MASSKLTVDVTVAPGWRGLLIDAWTQGFDIGHYAGSETNHECSCKMEALKTFRKQLPIGPQKENDDA